MSRCLSCGETVSDAGDYHKRCMRELFDADSPPIVDLDEATIERLAREVVNRRLAVPGVQRKLSLALERGAGGSRLTLVGVFGGTHILKPPTPEFPDLPVIEHATMRLAAAFGIKTAAHGLVRMKDGRFSYITRRFDRVRGAKLAVEDLCQLAEVSTEQKYRYSAERAGKVVRRFATNPGDDVLSFFESVLFAFVSGNADMHLKNFSLLTTADGRVALAPAYDLVATRLLISEHEDPEELALPLNGRKSKLGRADFETLGRALQLPDIVVRRTLDRPAKNLSILRDALSLGFLSVEQSDSFRKLIEERVGRLGG